MEEKLTIDFLVILTILIEQSFFFPKQFSNVKTVSHFK